MDNRRDHGAEVKTQQFQDDKIKLLTFCTHQAEWSSTSDAVPRLRLILMQHIAQLCAVLYMKPSGR